MNRPTVICENVPAAALPAIADELRKFGAAVFFDSATCGRVHSPSGKMRFEHRDNRLHVDLVEDPGHFPPALIIGGIKQTVAEAVERMALRGGAYACL